MEKWQAGKCVELLCIDLSNIQIKNIDQYYICVL